MTYQTYLRFPKESEQFAASDKVHDHVEVERVLEVAPEVDDEWMSDAR